MAVDMAQIERSDIKHYLSAFSNNIYIYIYI